MSEPAPSRSRRLARELAFQASYMTHIGRASASQACETLLARRPLTNAARAYMEQVVTGIGLNRSDIDALLSPLMASGWTLDRIAVSDLTVLRLACFELWHMPGIPPKVTITEAVEIAKRFGTADSGAFVHGVLGNLLPLSPKAEWDPTNEEVVSDLDGDEGTPPVEADWSEADLVTDTPPQEPPASPWQIRS